MAKKAYSPDPKAETIERIRRTEAYAEKVRRSFAATVNAILALNNSVPTLDDGVMYSFDGDNMRIRKGVEALLRRLHSVATTAIRKGIALEWEQANIECDKLLSSCFGEEVLFSPEFSGWTNRNTAAMHAFADRTEEGLNLSGRIWQSVQQLRDEMEIAMTVAIGEGDSAQSISRKVRKYLNDPDLMFRRFRFKRGEDEQGKPLYGRKWKKRIRDPKTGKYRWIDYDRKGYKTGAGVYKSSARNAMRVARSETNIAYRRADNERWRQMDFVLGQRIQLSKNHPKKDICDKLAGDYPKDFVFDGWHVQCFCFATPILLDEEEMAKVTKAFLKGEKYTPQGRQLTEYPANFKAWVRDNKEQILASRQRGTEPYFIRNNARAIDAILDPEPQELTIAEKAALRHEARTPGQEAALRNAWARRDAKKIGKSTSAQFGAEAYTQKRKDAAFWTESREEGDRHYSIYAEEDWKKWMEEEKHVAYLYTSDSRYINEPLFAKYYETKYSDIDGSARNSWRDINTLTYIIDKTKPLARDVWMQHGEDMNAFIGKFGVNLETLSASQLKSMVGKIGTNAPFTSCGVTKGSGFSHKQVILNIYCPKGTKGIYTEPYSHYGDGGYEEAGFKWDGNSRLAAGYAPGTEMEFILQRGSKFRIAKIEKKGYQYYIEVDLIEQPAKLPDTI